MSEISFFIGEDGRDYFRFPKLHGVGTTAKLCDTIGLVDDEIAKIHAKEYAAFKSPAVIKVAVETLGDPIEREEILELTSEVKTEEE